MVNANYAKVGYTSQFENSVDLDQPVSWFVKLKQADQDPHCFPCNQ